MSVILIKQNTQCGEAPELKNRFFVVALLLTVLFLLTACVVQKPVNSDIPPGADEAGAAASADVQDAVNMPALPGSDVTGDPSANLKDLVSVSGVVKEISEGLVLITCADGSDFMLRFSENSVWAEGVTKEISVGNTISCTVKPEPTFAPPSQGEVFEVTKNSAAK